MERLERRGKKYTSKERGNKFLAYVITDSTVVFDRQFWMDFRAGTSPTYSLHSPNGEVGYWSRAGTSPRLKDAQLHQHISH